MAFDEDWWDRDPVWRDAAYVCTSSASVCFLCGNPRKRSLQAIPLDRSRPFDDLVAVCGQCKVAARRHRVVPEDYAAGNTLGPVMAHQITPARWRMNR